LRAALDSRDGELPTRLHIGGDAAGFRLLAAKSGERVRQNYPGRRRDLACMLDPIRQPPQEYRLLAGVRRREQEGAQGSRRKNSSKGFGCK
jgi:hypothetical protein